MAKIVEVWRLEHINCPNLPGNVYTNRGSMPAHVKHGPHVYISHGDSSNCIGSARPRFGSNGAPPTRISPDHFCGVTRRQMGSWWDVTRAEFLEKQKLWRNAGWSFVIYKMPKTRVRWDRNQIIFNPLNAQDRRVIPWSDVPLPRS